MLLPEHGGVSRSRRSTIKAWCVAHPGVTLYGEVYGNVQSLTYGLGKGDVRFIAFAAADHGRWIDQGQLFLELESAGIPCCPVLHAGPFDREHIKRLAETDSTVASVAGHMMEGVVVVPEFERFHGSVGRVAVKHISNRYWEAND